MDFFMVKGSHTVDWLAVKVDGSINKKVDGRKNKG
jgi:hypothetical protein